MKRSAPQRKSGLKRSQPRRDWTDATAKVEAEGCCRVCGDTWNLEAAHIIGRVHDQPKLVARAGGIHRSDTLYVHQNSVVPLCGPKPSGWPGCHQKYDSHSLDLLPYLTTEEQVRAVADCGSVLTMLKRTTGDSYEPRQEAA